MPPFTRRMVGSLAAILAFGVPALSAAAVPATDTGTDPAAPSAADVGTSCDPDGVHISFVLDPAAAVSAISVTGISSACTGHEVAVVVAGVSGRAFVEGARTEVELEHAVPADEVTTLTVALTAP